MIREILKMGDARLLRVAAPVERVGTPELDALIADMFDTMEAAGGVGLAATMIAAARRARVIAVDVAPAALELARRFGATDVVDGAAPDGAGVPFRHTRK